MGVLALASACGGSDGPLSVSDFREQAQENCRELEETTGSIPPPSSVDDLKRFADESVAAVEDAVADARSLEPPDEFKEQWDEYLPLLDRLLANMRDLADEIEGASAAEIPEIVARHRSEFNEVETRGHEIERKLGLDDCVD